MAMSRPLELYLQLERTMLELEKANDPLADHIRDLMDPVWRQLSDREIMLLDARGNVGDAGLYSVQLPPPASAGPFPNPTVADQRFEGPSGAGWRSAGDWKRVA